MDTQPLWIVLVTRLIILYYDYFPSIVRKLRSPFYIVLLIVLSSYSFFVLYRIIIL